MVGTNLRSRSNRRRKKRKNNRNLMIFLALAFLFFTILLSLIVLNKNVDSEVEQEGTTKENKVTENETETKKDTNDSETDKDANESDEEEKEEEKENDDTDKSEEESSVSVKELDPEEINDSNVEKAFVGEWSPIGTSQKGSHTTNYSNGSQDRIEIKKAVSAVTKVDEDNMVEWRVENGGDQNVIATVSDDNETQYYRVYLTWVDDQGWQVNKLEDLKQNDKK